MAETGELVRLEELYRDAKILEIFEGANELRQWVIARQLIGRDVTGLTLIVRELWSARRRPR